MFSRHLILYIALGIITVPNTCLEICGSDFHDVISKTILAELVVSGKMVKKVKSILSEDDDNYAINFEVDEIIKADNDSERKLSNNNLITIETFSNIIEDPVECIHKDVEENVSYVMFLNSTKFSKNFIFKLNSFPVINADNVSKKIKNGLCPDCLVAPTTKIMEDSNVKEVKWGRSSKLDCDFKGKPTPVITWFLNGETMEDNLHFHMKSGKTSSRLEMIKLMNDSAGNYTCMAENILGKSMATIEIVIKPVKTYVTTDLTITCPKRLNKDYCLNNGICVLLIHNFVRLCKCDEPNYYGPRCQIASTKDEVKDKGKFTQPSMKELMMIISAIVVSLILIAVIIGSIYVCKRHRRNHGSRRLIKNNSITSRSQISNNNNNKQQQHLIDNV